MGFWSGVRRHAGFLTLFTVLTSTTLNTMTFARLRREDRKLHKLQCAVLHQLCSTLHAMPSSSKVTLEEQRRIVRRVRALQIDPMRLGISRAALPSDEAQARARQAMQAQTSWGKALFGVGTLSRARQAMGKALDNMTGQTPLRESGTAIAHAEESDEEIDAWLESKFKYASLKRMRSTDTITLLPGLGDETSSSSDRQSKASEDAGSREDELHQFEKASASKVPSQRPPSWFRSADRQTEIDHHDLLLEGDSGRKESRKVHIVF